MGLPKIWIMLNLLCLLLLIEDKSICARLQAPIQQLGQGAGLSFSKLRYNVLHVRKLMRTLCNKTDKCPSDAKSWQKKSERFNCGKRAYTCILTADDDLVEICMITYNIPKNYAGCPVIRCDFGDPALSPDEFAFCPGNIRGCPTANHSGYSTDSVFKYPRCLLRRRDRLSSFSMVERSTSTCNTSEIGGVVHIKSHDIPLLVVLPVVIVILLLIAFIFAVYFKRKGYAQRLCKTNEKRYGNRQTLPAETVLKACCNRTDITRYSRREIEI